MTRLVAAACVVFFVTVFGLVAFHVGWPLVIVFGLVAMCGVVDLIVLTRS